MARNDAAVISPPPAPVRDEANDRRPYQIDGVHAQYPKLYG